RASCNSNARSKKIDCLPSVSKATIQIWKDQTLAPSLVSRKTTPSCCVLPAVTLKQRKWTPRSLPCGRRQPSGSNDVRNAGTPFWKAFPTIPRATLVLVARVLQITDRNIELGISLSKVVRYLYVRLLADSIFERVAGPEAAWC